MLVGEPQESSLQNLIRDLQARIKRSPVRTFDYRLEVSYHGGEPGIISSGSGSSGCSCSSGCGSGSGSGSGIVGVVAVVVVVVVW